MDLARASLDDRYRRTHGPIFLTGIQALVRLPLDQKRRDLAAGLLTAGFISGYRGSPLAGFDRQLWSAQEELESHCIHFVPGVNEELGATAVWGSQQVNAFRGARYDGVFGLWYGKAPGVDRASDALKHGNAAGSSRHGGVLVIAGDDHACKSSTLPSQSEFALMDAGIPVLSPADVQDVLDLGLHGWALSRLSGLFVGVIALADTMDSASSAFADPDRVAPALPHIHRPPGGLHFRPGVPPLEQEERLHRYKLPAALAYARANALNRTVIDAPEARFGIVTVGKAHLDVLQALEDLGIDRARARALGLRVFKVGMAWPLEPEGLRDFASGLQQILVVEEKRSFVETQLKELLYGTSGAPSVIGKRDERGRELLPAIGDLTPAAVARAIADRIPDAECDETIVARLATIAEREQALAESETTAVRVPFYCSGCPHNRSTVLPAGSRGLAGIGCHYMVQWMDRNTDAVSQMGGEGASWIGQAPFTEEAHVFANLGDGTYFHSGLLAIRAAVAAGVNITYKILYNDAVAMTGGQAVDGPLSVARITHQCAAEGVAAIAVVSDDPSQHRRRELAAGTRLLHRDGLDALQRELRETPGCTVLIYDQTCAAELRRRRKRGTAVDPDRRLFINEAVCEGCGDCSVQSNCAAVEPVETEFGRKRRINQTSCNKDFSCANGLCPAFVSVRGGRLRRAATSVDEEALAAVPLPTPPGLDEPWSVLITGIGGTGVVTVGALLGMAAHLDGNAASTLDQTGLAQKGGAVSSQVRIARTPEQLHTPRIPMGCADALLACDAVVATSPAELAKLEPGRTHTVVNAQVAPTAEFVLDNSVVVDPELLMKTLHEQSRVLDVVQAGEIASRVLGDAVTSNTLLLGYAFQKGLVPVSLEALNRAIELNDVAVRDNLRAFALGRLAAHDLAAIQLAEIAPPGTRTLAEQIARRTRDLAAYQNTAWGERYRSMVECVHRAEGEAAFGADALSRAVAWSYYKLLAYKDEYEVARLYTDGHFEKRIAEEFEGDYRIELELAPPLWASRDPATGRPVKRSYGRWMFAAMRMLARLRFLRGTPFDPFGRTAERRMERRLIADYEHTLEILLAGLTPENHAVAVEIASLPQQIVGYDEVKRRNAERAQERQAALMEQFCKQEHAPAFDLPLLPVLRRKGPDA